MGVGRAQDRRVERIRPDRQIVGEAPAAAQQVGVFEAADRAPRIRTRICCFSHLPVNFGGRFWWKAATPSRKSSELRNRP